MCHHLVALAQLGHAGAARRDRPCRLRPERHRSRAAALSAADPDKLVPVSDAGGDDVDEDLACGSAASSSTSKILTGSPSAVIPAARILLGARDWRR
jgi:hypothetical protein